MTSKTRLVYLLITTFCLAGCGYKSRNPVSKNGLPSADTIQTALAPRYAKGTALLLILMLGLFNLWMHLFSF